MLLLLKRREKVGKIDRERWGLAAEGREVQRRAPTGVDYFVIVLFHQGGELFRDFLPVP